VGAIPSHVRMLSSLADRISDSCSCSEGVSGVMDALALSWYTSAVRLSPWAAAIADKRAKQFVSSHTVSPKSFRLIDRAFRQNL